MLKVLREKRSEGQTRVPEIFGKEWQAKVRLWRAAGEKHKILSSIPSPKEVAFTYREREILGALQGSEARKGENCDASFIRALSERGADLNPAIITKGILIESQGCPEFLALVENQLPELRLEARMAAHKNYFDTLRALVQESTPHGRNQKSRLLERNDHVISTLVKSYEQECKTEGTESSCEAERLFLQSLMESQVGIMKALKMKDLPADLRKHLEKLLLVTRA